MAENSNTLTMTLQFKENGSVVVDTAKGKIDQLNQSVIQGGGQSAGMLGQMKSNWLALAGGVTAGYLAIRKGVDVITDLVNSAAEAEEIEKRAAFQMETWGYNFKEIKPYVDEFAESIQKTTRFSDEMATESLGKMMQYTGSVEDAMKGVRLAMDLSTQTGMDLDSTTRLVGMAMNGNVEILGRWIPELRDLDSKLGAGASSAEKAAYAFEVFNKKFSGAALADLRTYAGQIAQLGNEWDEVKKSLGRGLMPFADQWVQGVKSILASGKLFENDTVFGKMLNLMATVPNFALGKVKENIDTSKASETDVAAAKKKADEQNSYAKKQYDYELSLKTDIEKLDLDYLKKYEAFNNNKIALIRLERDEAIKAAEEKYKGVFTAETSIQKIKEYYAQLELKQIKENEKAEIDALFSLSSLWKSYYDERISKQNEMIGLLKASGVSTTIGAKFEFSGVMDEFRKISEQANLMTSDEFEKVKASYTEKLKNIAPYQGGQWEKIPVVTGSEMGTSGPRSTWGTDYRWNQGTMDDQQKSIEDMRESYTKLIEQMSKDTIPTMMGQTAASIGAVFDEPRNKVYELQQEIQKIDKLKLEVQTDELTTAINKVKELDQVVTDLSNKVCNVQVEINGNSVVQQIDQGLADLYANKRSVFRNAIEGENR